jgi:hypothetical protein
MRRRGPFLVLACAPIAIAVACTLNPQPLPPDHPEEFGDNDASTTTDGAANPFDNGKSDATASGSSGGSSSSGSSSGGGGPDGGSADAGTGLTDDGSTPRADGGDAEASDASDAGDAPDDG